MKDFKRLGVNQFQFQDIAMQWKQMIEFKVIASGCPETQKYNVAAVQCWMQQEQKTTTWQQSLQTI